MITLDTNLTLYPGLYYYLPMVQNQNTKAYSAIDQYADTKTASTDSASSTNATNSTNATDNKPKVEIPTDASALIEMLKLELPESKIAILKQIPHSELLQFMYLLDKDQLLSGLKLFTKEKLLNFISNLSKQDLLKMLNKMYISQSHILEAFSIKELNHFLSSKRIDKSQFLKVLQNYSATELTQIAEAATGTTQGKKTHAQMMDVLNGLDTAQIADGVKGVQYKKMTEIISGLLDQNPSLYTEFSQEALFLQTNDFPKTTLVEGMGVLDNEMLIGCLNKLPDSFLALVATQVDTEDLANILINNYQDLLSQVFSA